MRIDNLEVVQAQLWTDGGPEVYENHGTTTYLTRSEGGILRNPVGPRELARQSLVSLDFTVQGNPAEYSAKVKMIDDRFTVACYWSRYWLSSDASDLLKVYAILAVMATPVNNKVAVKIPVLSTVIGADAEPLISTLIEADLLTEDDRIPTEWRSLTPAPRRFAVTQLPGNVLEGIALDSGGWPNGREDDPRSGEDEDGSLFAAAFLEATEGD